MTQNTTAKKIIFSAITAGALGFLLSAGIAFADQGKGDAEMILQTAQAKKPATFPHAKHQAVLACSECHHSKNEGGTQESYVEGQEIQKCASCHNKEAMTNETLNSFKNVAHALCKTCHKELAQANKPTGPTKCNGCHIKQ